jgi:hypothetical protein
MSHFARRFLTVIGVVCLMFAASVALAEKRFADSEDAREKDEPQKFLPDYDKLVKGSNADWVYFPDGGLTAAKYKTVSVSEFDHTGRGTECRDAAREGKDYAEQWLEKEGFKVVKSGGDLQIEGNVFNAWEPSGAARYWGGWAANPGAGMELICKAGGKVVIRPRARPLGTPSKTASRT